VTSRRRTAWPRPEAAGRPHADLAWSRALAHPVRVEILLALLEHEPGSPSGFAQTLEIPLGVASHHMRRLRELRLVQIARRTHHRGAVQHHYRLVDRAATARALWRWGLAPDDVVPMGPAEELGPGAAERETVRRVVGELRRLRERRGISQAALAARVRIRPEHLGRVERGEADPRMTVLLMLAAELGVSMRDLFAAAEGEDDAAPQAA